MMVIFLVSSELTKVQRGYTEAEVEFGGPTTEIASVIHKIRAWQKTDFFFVFLVVLYLLLS